MNNCEALSNQGAAVAESNIFNTSISSINKREVFSYTHQRNNSAIISPLQQLTPNQQDSQIYIANPIQGEAFSIMNYFSPQLIRSASNNNLDHANSQRPDYAYMKNLHNNFNFKNDLNYNPQYQNQQHISNQPMHSNHQSLPQCLTSSNYCSSSTLVILEISKPRNQSQEAARVVMIPQSSNPHDMTPSKDTDHEFDERVKVMREQILLEKQRELNKQIEDLRYHQQLVQQELEKLNVEARLREEGEAEMKSRADSRDRDQNRQPKLRHDNQLQNEGYQLTMSKFSFNNPLHSDNYKNNFILNSQQLNANEDVVQNRDSYNQILSQHQNTLNFYPQQNMPFQPIFRSDEELELTKGGQVLEDQEQNLTEEDVSQQIKQTQVNDFNQYQSVQQLTTEDIQDNFPQSPYWNTLEQDQEQNRNAVQQNQTTADELRERVQMNFMRESRDSQTRNHISSVKPSTFQNAPSSQNDKKIGSKRLSIYLSQSTKAINDQEDKNQEVYERNLNQSEINPNNFCPGASSIDRVSISNTISSNQIQFLQFQASGKNLHANLDQSYDLSKYHATSKDQSMHYQELQKKLNTNSSRMLTQEFQPPPEPISYPNLPVLHTEEESQIAKVEASVASAAHPLEYTGSMKQSPRYISEGAQDLQRKNDSSAEDSFSLDLTSLKKKAEMNSQLQVMLNQYETMQDYINMRAREQKDGNLINESQESEDYSLVQDFKELKRCLLRMVEAEERLIKELQRKGMHKNQVLGDTQRFQLQNKVEGLNTDSSLIYQTQRQSNREAIFDGNHNHFFTQQSDSSYPYLNTDINYEQELNLPQSNSNISSYLHTNTLYSAQDSHRDGQAQYATQALNSVQKLTTNTSLANSSRIHTQKKKQAQSSQRNQYAQNIRQFEEKNIVIDDLEEDISLEKKYKLSGDAIQHQQKGSTYSYAQIHSTKSLGNKHSKFLMGKNDSKLAQQNFGQSPTQKGLKGEAISSTYNMNYQIPSQKIAEIKANSNKKLSGQASRQKHSTQSNVVQKLTQPTISSRNKSTERYTLQVWNERSKQNETLYQSVLHGGKSPAREKSYHSKEMSQDNFYSQGQKARVKSPVFIQAQNLPCQQKSLNPPLRSQQIQSQSVQSYQKLQQIRRQPVGSMQMNPQNAAILRLQENMQNVEQREKPEFKIPDEPSSIKSNKQTEGDYNISNITQKVPSSFAESNFEMIDQFREHGFPLSVPQCASLRSLAEQQIGSKISSRPTEKVSSEHQEENNFWKTTINFDSPKENSKDQIKVLKACQESGIIPSAEEQKISPATLQFFSDQNKELTLGKQIPDTTQGGSLEEAYPEVRQFVIDSQDLRFEGSSNSNQISPRDPIAIQDMYKNFMHKDGNMNSQISTLARITPIISPQTNFKQTNQEEVKNIGSLSELSCHPVQNSERMTPILQKYQEKIVMKSPRNLYQQTQNQNNEMKSNDDKAQKYTLDMLHQNQGAANPNNQVNKIQKDLQMTLESSRNVTNQRSGNVIGQYGHSNQSSIHQINIGLQHSLMNNQLHQLNNQGNLSQEVQAEEIKIQLTNEQLNNTQKSSPRLGGQSKSVDGVHADKQAEIFQTMARNKAQQNRITEIRNQIQAQKESQKQAIRTQSNTKTIQRYSARPVDRSASGKRNSDMSHAQVLSFTSKNQHRRQMSNIESLILNKKLIEEDYRNRLPQDNLNNGSISKNQGQNSEFLSFDSGNHIYKTSDGTQKYTQGRQSNQITDKKSLTAFLNSRKVDANKQLREQIVDQIQERERLKSRQHLAQESVGGGKPQFQKTVINRVNSNQKLLSQKQQTVRVEESKTLREQMMLVSSRIQANNNNNLQGKLNNTQPTKTSNSRRQDYQTMLKQSFLNYLSPKGADKGSQNQNKDLNLSPQSAVYKNLKQEQCSSSFGQQVQKTKNSNHSGLISQQKVDKYIKTSPSRFLKGSNMLNNTQQDQRYQANKSPHTQLFHQTQPLNRQHQQNPQIQQDIQPALIQKPGQYFSSGNDSKMSFIIEVVQSDSTLFDHEYRQAGADSRIATDRGDSRYTNSQGTQKEQQQPPTNIIIYRGGGNSQEL